MKKSYDRFWYKCAKIQNWSMSQNEKLLDSQSAQKHYLFARKAASSLSHIVINKLMTQKPVWKSTFVSASTQCPLANSGELGVRPLLVLLFTLSSTDWAVASSLSWLGVECNKFNWFGTTRPALWGTLTPRCGSGCTVDGSKAWAGDREPELLLVLPGETGVMEVRGPELYDDIAIIEDGLGGAPCWVSACLRRSTFLWKARPHRVHANGLKPECLRLCVIRLDDCENAFPHSLHTYGFSPVKKI